MGDKSPNPQEDELAALEAIVKLFNQIDEDAQTRIIRYIIDRYDLPVVLS